MTAFSVLVFFISLAFIFLINPIVLACRLGFKAKLPIIFLACASIVTLGITSFIAYIVIIISMKEENYFNYGNDNQNRLVRQNEKSNYVIHLIFYAIEFLVMLLPIISIDENTAEISLGNLKSSYNVFDLKDSPFGTSECAYILIGIIVAGFIMNFLVKDPRKTMFFDGIIQLVYIFIVIMISRYLDDLSYKDINEGFGMVLMALSVIIFIGVIFFSEVMAICPEPFNKKEIVSNE